MGDICIICGTKSINKVEISKLGKILARMIVAENVKDFYILSEGPFADEAGAAIRRMQDMLSGIGVHEGETAPRDADMVLCPYTRAEAERDEALAALLRTGEHVRLICLSEP